jgi:membrane protease YdiL (CAAX protease family)
MSRSQIALVLHALATIGALLVLVPRLTAIDPVSGYLLSLVFYWMAFCVPVIALHVWKRHDGRLFSEALAWRDWWIPGLLLLQVGLIAALGVVPHTALLTTQGAMLAATVALLNGPLEEAAWRGGFITTFRDRPRLGFWLNWVLFTAWHIPLALSHGIDFMGGWPVFIGGAAALGLWWSWIAWRTGSVFWVAIAHTLTNTLTFWVLFNANGFVSPHH